MVINVNTKIGSLIKFDSRVIDAIVSINPKFEKLRNPVLRKFIANRTTIQQASRIANCKPEDFFARLKPLGFETEEVLPIETIPDNEFPAFVKDIAPENIISFDVRPILSSNADPLQDILAKVRSLLPGQVLKIINTFEPTPLISLLHRQGFESFVNMIDYNLIETYFYKKEGGFVNKVTIPRSADNDDWNDVLKIYRDKIQEIDVRHLEMPQPMLAILDGLDNLPQGYALYVHHKRIPVFLLPELNERGFDYRIKEQSDNEVYLLIFRF
jgi:uncharacterized protein (DUF2249 family)